MGRIMSLFAAFVLAIFLVSCGGENPMESTVNGFSQPQALAKAAVADNVSNFTAEVVVTVTKDGAPLGDVEVLLARSVSGQSRIFLWSGITKPDGITEIQINPLSNNDQYWRIGASGYYIARAFKNGASNVRGEQIGEWGSIPINGGEIAYIELPIDGHARVEKSVPITGVIPGDVFFVPHVVIDKDPIMTDRNEVVPTGVSGSSNVRLGSVMVGVLANAEVRITEVLVSGDVDDDMLLGRVFRNLSLRFVQTQTQVGQTIGTFHGGPFVFRPVPVIMAPAGSTLTFDVYADINSNVSSADLQAINNDPNGVLNVSVKAVGTVTGQQVVAGPCNLQRVYIAEHGSLEFRVDPAFTKHEIPNYLDGKVEVASFITRAVGEDITAISLPFMVPKGAVSPWVPNLYTQVDGQETNHAWTDQMTPGGVMNWNSLFGGGLVFPKGKEVRVFFRATAKSIGGLPDIEAGKLIQIDLVKGDLNLVGMTSGRAFSSPAVAGIPIQVVGAGEELLFPPIELNRSFALLRSGYANVFSSGRSGETVKIAITFLIQIPSDIRMVFESSDGEFLALKADEVAGSTATFSFAWTGSHVQQELISLGIEDRPYGWLSFYGPASSAGKLAKLAGGCPIRSFVVTRM